MGLSKKGQVLIFNSGSVTASFVRPGEHFAKNRKDFMFAVTIFCLVQEREGVMLSSSASSLQKSSARLFLLLQMTWPKMMGQRCWCCDRAQRRWGMEKLHVPPHAQA